MTVKRSILLYVSATEMSILLNLLQEHIECRGYWGNRDIHYKRCDDLFDHMQSTVQEKDKVQP